MRPVQLLHDAYYGIRVLRRHPTFTTMAALLLAVGIAANTAIFSVFNGLFLSSLPYPDAERLVYLHEAAPAWGMKYLGVSSVDLSGWRAQNRTFTDVAGFIKSGVYLTGFGETTRVNIANVTHNLTHTLGIRPILGREIVPEEDRDGPPWLPSSGHRVVLLTYGFWQRWFGGAPDVLGKIIHLDNLPYTVIGVLPPQAVYPAHADVWAPLGFNITTDGYGMEVIGRLRPGVSVEHAAADLARIHSQIPEARSHKSKLTFPVVVPLRQHYLGDYRIVSQVLMAAVFLVLLIACLNVAGLMMARGTVRAREVAIRMALGAGQRRLTQQLLVESALLAGASAVIGVALGWVTVRAMLSLMPDVLPPWVEFKLDARFLFYTLSITTLATLASGAGPAFQSLRADVRSGLAGAGLTTSLSGKRRRSLRLLVLGEIAIALVLLAAGGLALEAFHQVAKRDPGFRAENVLTFSVDPPILAGEQRFQIYQRLLDRLRSSPAVEAAGATDYLPLGPGLLGRGDWAGWAFQPEGEPAERGNAALRSVTPGYFRAMGISLLAGRDFEDRDVEADATGVVVNDAFARAAWPGVSSVIGRRVRMHRPEWLTVIGVVHDIRHSGVEQPVRPEIFRPYSPQLQVPLALVVRGKYEASALATVARQAMRETDPSIAIFDVRSMQELLVRSLWTRRTYSWLFGVFAAIALLMAVAGVYGVVSCIVAQRTHEIGIRMALGAQPRQVVNELLREGMLLVGIGLAVGLAGAWYATRLMGSFLAGVSPHEPRAYAGVIVVLASAAFAANLIPARRSASVDPMQALRMD